MYDKEILVGAKAARIKDRMGELGKIVSIKTPRGHVIS